MKEPVASSVERISPGLITAGALGFHPLFETSSIRRAFANVEHGLISEQRLLLAHVALRELVSLDDIFEMREYLESLPEGVVDLLVFLYFRVVDQFIEDHEHTIH